MARVKEILLPEVTNLRTDFTRDVEVIVDDETDVCPAGDWDDCFRHPANLIQRGSLGPKLDQIRPAITKLLRYDFRRAAMQIGRVHKGIEFAVSERFHGSKK